MYCPDNYDAFVWHEAEREREEKEWRSKLPECSECGEKITDEDCYEINDELICPECIEANHKKRTENYMD